MRKQATAFPAQRARRVQALHVVFRYLLRYGTSGTWTVLGTGLGAATLAIAYQLLARAAEATYSEKGELIDGGADLTKPSPQTGLAKDVLWASVILMPLVGLTDYAWLLALGVPAFVAWQLYQTFSQGFGAMQGMGGGAEKPRSAKAEKRAERRRVKRI